jgi:hypothetical protein
MHIDCRLDVDLSYCRKLSLERLLEKLFTLHYHIQLILRIAWSRRLSPVLEGAFHVISVPSACGDIHLEFSAKKVLAIAFPNDQAPEDVKEMVYREILERLRAKASKDEINLTTGHSPEFSLQPFVHAESTLLAYHLQHSTQSFCYFGGSKLSCHACSLLFTCFNNVAISFGHSQYFTRGSHNKIYLRWCFPSLPRVQQGELQAGAPSLDIEVKKEMIKVLDREMAIYIRQLSGRLGESTPARTAASNAQENTISEAVKFASGT